LEATLFIEPNQGPYCIAKKIVGQCSTLGSTPGTPCKQMQWSFKRNWN